MDFRQLRYFVTVARFLSFSKAAKHLGKAQSALSYNIAALEEELRVRLFVRDTRSVRLTECGAVFLREAEDMLRRMEQTVERVRTIDAGFAGTLRAAFLSSIIKKYYSEWIPPFEEKYPGTSLVTGQMPMSDLRRSLMDGAIDVAFTRSFDIEGIPEFDSLRLYSETCSLVFPGNHRFAELESIDFAALADEPFITLAPETSPNWYKKVLEICRRRGFEPNIVQTPFSIEAVYNLLEFGMGIGILPSANTLFDMPNLRVVELEDDETTHVDIVAAWRRDSLNPTVPLFIDELRAYLEGAK